MKNRDERPGSWLREHCFAPVDAASTVFFRVTFGLMMAFDQLHYVLGERLEARYLEPLFLFKYPGFEWVRSGSEDSMRLVFWGLAALALSIALGFLYRTACALFFLGYVYVFLLDAASYNNHYYLVCLISFVMIFIPAHTAGSVDVLLRPRLRSATIPIWAVRLLQFNVALPYFFGGLAKLNYDWLVRAQPMRLWLTTGGIEESFRFEIFDEPWTAYLFTWGGLLFDLAVVPLLLFPRTRIPAYILAVAFHLNNAFMFNIGFFPWLMICATLIFFPPDWPRRAGLLRRAEKSRTVDRKLEEPTRRQMLVPVLLALYVAVHLFLPFRHLLYPGPVDWTEEGHRFAWRMKLRDKRGKIWFAVIDHERRQVQVLEDYDSILTGHQRLMMTQDPEMIRQFACFLAGKFLQETGREVEVRAQTSLSLNGREPQAIIDPEVDLTKVRREHLRSADWIQPLEN